MTTNHDLHILITRLEGKVDAILDKQDASQTWQETHEKNDEERFSNLNKYAASIAMVAGAIGASGAYIWNRITGKT